MGHAGAARDAHWNQVYSTKGELDVSWFEASPSTSIELLEAAGMNTRSCVLDVGGGDSHLVDVLLTRGLTCLAVLDVSGAALARVQARLGDGAQVPVWIEADVTSTWSLKPMDLWHDRAVFHFLTAPEDRARYADRLFATLTPGGSAIIATFALDGPERCSGLPVQRYSPESLAAELGPRLRLVESRHHLHTTPWGRTQSFQYSWLRRVG